MSPPLIRPARVDDIEALVAFNQAMAMETEHKQLDATRLRAGVAAVFADPARGFYLVVEADGRVVACLMVTFEWSDWRNGNWWWIQSVYVDAQARRSGVFSALYREVEARARAAGDVVGLRLYVEQENDRAQATYLRLGMQRSHYQQFETEF